MISFGYRLEGLVRTGTVLQHIIYGNCRYLFSRERKRIGLNECPAALGAAHSSLVIVYEAGGGGDDRMGDLPCLVSLDLVGHVSTCTASAWDRLQPDVDVETVRAAVYVDSFSLVIMQVEELQHKAVHRKGRSGGIEGDVFS